MTPPARFKDICLDARDQHALADWWCTAMGYVRRDELHPPEDGWVRPADWPVPIVDPAGHGPLIWLVPVTDEKVVENRMHHDVVGDTQRLLDLGATLVRANDRRSDGEATDWSAGDIEWDVLADPEGNEFCCFAPDRHAFPQPEDQSEGQSEGQSEDAAAD